MKIDNISEKIKTSFLKDLGKLGFINLFHISNGYLIGEKRLFGTYYLPYFSEMLGFENEESIISLGDASLFGRAFVIAQDQILDNPEKPNIDYLLLSPLLLKEFIVKLQVLMKKFNLEKEVRGILFDSMTANKNEQNKHKNKITPYTKEDLKKSYLKTGIIGIPPIVICSLIDKPSYKNSSLFIARNLLVCVQICDDLADVAEDFNSGNFTLPVTHGILLSKKGKKDIESMYEGLLLSGLIEFLCNFVINTLGDVTKEIKQISNKECQIGLYVLSLKSYIEKILEEITKVKIKKGLPIDFNKEFLQLKPVGGSKDSSSLISILKKFEPANIAPNKLINKSFLVLGSTPLRST